MSQYRRPAPARRDPPSDVVLRERTYAPHAVLEQHSHPYAALVLVLHGGFREACGPRTDSRRPGALRIMPAGQGHSNIYGASGARCFLVEIHAPRLGELSDRIPALDQPRLFAPSTGPAILADAMHSEFIEPDGLTPLAVDGLLCELLVSASRTAGQPSPGRAPAWLARVHDRIQDEFRHPPTLNELALEAGVHPHHLCLIFRRTFHCTIGEYARQLRIEWTQRALVSTAQPVAHIALAAGFSDQAHFTRQFHAALGVTPARYRRLAAARRARIPEPES